MDPSDLVQESLVAACESIDQFRGGSDEELAAWLRQILENRLLNAVRRMEAQCRDINRDEPLNRDPNEAFARVENWLDDQSSPSHQVSRIEQWLRVATALEQLSPTACQCITLRYLEGQTMHVIAQQLQLTERAVAGQIYRGMKQLQKLLRQE